MSRRGFRRIGGMAFWLVISFLFVPMVSGNFSIISDNNLVSSQGILESDDHMTFLKEVNISIDLYEDRADGKGYYMFFNPGNETEDLSIFFDPSYYADNCRIELDGAEVFLNEIYLEDDYYRWIEEDRSFLWYFNEEPYPVKTLNVSVGGNSSVIMNVTWSTDPYVIQYEESSMGPNPIPFGYDEYYKTKITDWGNSYLVFSNSSWPEPIDSFRLKFHSHHDNFNSPNIRVIVGREWISTSGSGYHTPPEGFDLKRSEDGEGNLIVDIHLEDWWKEDTYIVYDGVDEEVDVTEGKWLEDVCCFITILIPILLLGSFIVFIIYRKRR